MKNFEWFLNEELFGKKEDEETKEPKKLTPAERAVNFVLRKLKEVKQGENYNYEISEKSYGSYKLTNINNDNFFLRIKFNGSDYNNVRISYLNKNILPGDIQPEEEPFGDNWENEEEAKNFTIKGQHILKGIKEIIKELKDKKDKHVYDTDINNFLDYIQ